MGWRAELGAVRLIMTHRLGSEKCKCCLPTCVCRIIVVSIIVVSTSDVSTSVARTSVLTIWVSIRASVITK